jgi:hypothetical protein
MEAKMRLPLLSLFLLFAASSAARADDFRLISQARTGGWGQPFGLNEDLSNFSVSCR